MQERQVKLSYHHFYYVSYIKVILFKESLYYKKPSVKLFYLEVTLK